MKHRKFFPTSLFLLFFFLFQVKGFSVGDLKKYFTATQMMKANTGEKAIFSTPMKRKH